MELTVASPIRFFFNVDALWTRGCREYQCRKNRNEGKGDAVYTNLEYKPVCNCMPVCKVGRLYPSPPLFSST